MLRAAEPPRPNVVLMLAGTWRGQTMPGGDEDLRAPNLTRLITEGVQFRRAYSADPEAAGAATALWTGAFPHAKREASLLRVFEQAGYRASTDIEQKRDAPFFATLDWPNVPQRA